MEIWQGGDWVNYLRYEYTYDGSYLGNPDGIQSNLIEEIKQEWNGSDWVNKEKQTYEYIPTAVEETEGIVINYSLSQNYPNPFNPSTTIKWQQPGTGFVTLKIYDVLGREVITLVNDELNAGKHEIEFNSHSSEVRNLSSGIYFYQLKVDSFVETKKMVLLK